MSSRAAFSLIEVLVATTVLMIIVLMVAMVFQQGTWSWTAGTRRADTQMTLRTVLGAIQRDLVDAVDARAYGLENSFPEVSGSFIGFVAMNGRPTANGLTRAPQRIEYSFADGTVTRFATPVLFVNGKWEAGDAGAADPPTVLNGSRRLKACTFTSVYAPGSDKLDLPVRVEIEGRVKSEGKDALVQARSLGRDRTRGTKDDIYVGGR